MATWSVRVERTNHCGRITISLPKGTRVGFSSEFGRAVNRHGPSRMIFGDWGGSRSSVYLGTGNVYESLYTCLARNPQQVQCRGRVYFVILNWGMNRVADAQTR